MSCSQVHTEDLEILDIGYLDLMAVSKVAKNYKYLHYLLLAVYANLAVTANMGWLGYAKSAT